MSLQEQLDAQRERSRKKHAPEKKEIMNKATQTLAESDIIASALKEGNQLIEFKLSNAKGEELSSSELLKNGPLVITFYRGGWCPYCNLELRALQAILPEIHAKGGQLIAITPETPDNSLSTQEKNELSFEVLTDAHNAYARQLGLVFQLPSDLREVYDSFGIDLIKSNGDESYELPLAATYVVDASGEISYAFLDADYTKRAEPQAILSVLDKLVSVS